jgi:hypothetical protein
MAIIGPLHCRIMRHSPSLSGRDKFPGICPTEKQFASVPNPVIGLSDSKDSHKGRAA